MVKWLWRAGYFNDMPKMVVELAAAAGVERPLHAVMEAPGGAGFVEHLANGRVQEHLSRSQWDYVVLAGPATAALVHVRP